MNIALSAVVISILLIHPFIFYCGIYLGKYSKAIPNFSLLEALLGSAIIALLIHGIAVNFIYKEIRFDILVKLLGGDLKNVEGSVRNDLFKNLLLEFVRYNFWLVLLVFAFGRVIRLILLFKNLHSFSASLHLYHEWWYYFNGYSYKEERIVEYDLIYVKAIIDTKNRTVLYNGYLMNFETIGKQLDRIYLANVSTMELKDLDQRIDDQSDILLTPNREYTLSLKYEHITHLSVEFIVLVNDQLRQGHN